MLFCNSFVTPYINNGLSRKIRIGSAMLAHLAGMAAVLTHHFLRFRCLMIVVRRLHFLILLARLFLHLFHLAFRLAHRPWRFVGCTRTQHGQKRTHANWPAREIFLLGVKLTSAQPILTFAIVLSFLSMCEKGISFWCLPHKIHKEIIAFQIGKVNIDI